MQHFSLLFESSPWFVALCLLAGLLYASILYYKTHAPWNKWINYGLFGLRFLLVFLIAILLVGPLIKQIYNSYEKPGIVLAIDNSKSIAEIESKDNLQQLKEKVNNLVNNIKEQGYSVEIRLLNGQQLETLDDSLKFNYNQTNLSQVLNEIQNDYESKNLAEVILLSDGIHNLGINPTYRPYSFPISTIGLGDTTQKPDINLNSLRYNKIAYKDNKFPIVAEIFTNGYSETELSVKLSHNGKLLDEHNIKLTSGQQFIEERFYVEAKEQGYQHYKVDIEPLENELSVTNNEKDAYIDIIEGKERILIVAPYPHPDIKAIRSALENNKNYEIQTYINGINKKPEGNNFDVYIFHQLPDNNNTQQAFVNEILNKKLPVWFILGNTSSIPVFNRLNNLVQINTINRQKDEVFPYYNRNFLTYNYNSDYEPIVSSYPPVAVPFANYNLNPEADVLFFQKVGSIKTKKPLMITGRTPESKQAVMLGSGMWQWRLSEFAQTDDTEAFDDFVAKTLQFLSAKEDKRRFKVFPVKNEFTDHESVIFEAEVYNEIYEPIYGQTINLKITNTENESSGYQYVTSEANTRYRINDLAPGVYHYEASTQLEGKLMTASGSFAVNKLQIENTMLQANHSLLKTLASVNGGSFYNFADMDNVYNDLSTHEAKSVIRTHEDYLSIINLNWLFFLLILFCGAEWFIRKYMGSY